MNVPMMVLQIPIINEFGGPSYEDLFRLLILIILVIVVALLAERIEKVRQLNQLNRDLENSAIQLHEANEELEAFAYSVSHDLRVPLRAIDGFSRILMEDYGDSLDEEGNRLISIVRDNTEKMGDLIDDILLLSRVGRQKMKGFEIDMEYLVRNVWEDLRPDWEGREIELIVDDLPNAQGDRILMAQVFQNLLSNSIKFTRNKNPAVIEVGAQNYNDEIIYYVKDNGAGFDMKYIDKLFGLFQRLHTAEEFEGTGVGLSIVQRIIKRHGGQVWGEGEPFKGATIYFTLPKV
ncbi:two-component sensor histidine kinase [Methanobacterium sp. CWC-01]|jgi:two-component system sensor kinase|uniref:sensor histidine kinase n=1 Tax=Methanobacterium aridiramus TaxID=2584467 RepID=UPI0025754A7B|nr:ATP-binding protein [Methanobacterium sp. CWC-01]WJI08758.1 two-component sensor histidine kinase [Methanobacterium sp. CWC-01]